MIATPKSFIYGIPGLRRISSQTVRNRLRQKKAVFRSGIDAATQTWKSPLVQQIEGLDITKLATNLDQRRVSFSPVETWWQNTCIWAPEWAFLFLLCSRSGGGVMMWAAISNDRKTDLVHTPGNLTAVRYRDEILQLHLMHVFDRERELFHQNNARPNTARVAIHYIEQNNINALPWPSKSPDLNPIEHLWDQLDKRVRQRQSPPQTLDQRLQMLQQKWRTIPRNNVRNLIESMPRRCRAVLVVYRVTMDLLPLC
jgi:transposase